MKRKLLPVFIMLLAGAIASILTAIMRYDLQLLLLVVFITLVVFYILGSIFVYLLNLFEKQNQKDSLDIGEVIEKDESQDVEDGMLPEEEILSEKQKKTKQETR